MLPEVKEENRELLQDALKRGFVTMKIYGEQTVNNILKIVDFSISEHADNHPKVEITYTKVSPFTNNRTEQSTMVLVVFNSASSYSSGEEGWRPAFKNRIFKGDPPFTVAIDVFRRNLYLVHIKENGIDLNLFREINEEDARLILEEASVKSPYSLRVPPEVLMDIIAQDEGYNHAYRNLQIVFNCSVPLVFNNGLIME